MAGDGVVSTAFQNGRHELTPISRRSWASLQQGVSTVRSMPAVPDIRADVMIGDECDEAMGT